MEATSNLQLCRICITSHSHCPQMISIFGEGLLWEKITTLADVKIERDDALPQQVCLDCAKNAISACLFKKKCEDADKFFRQLPIPKLERRNSGENHIEDIPTDVGRSDQPFELGTAGNYAVAPVRCGDESPDEEHEDDERHSQAILANEDGELKYANGKPSFDFQSIRLMHEYMQQQLSKINGIHKAPGVDNSACDSDGCVDDDEHLPLIPEIELITPADEVVATSDQGYQCPNCFEVFEMLHILKAHMKSVHGTPGPVYECSNCKKTYFYKRFLEKHVRRGRCVKKRRNQTRPMQCSDCNVVFPTGHHLGWHKRTGCPSRAAKMPLQQLLKQNIVEYNNFPKRTGIRKPENATYLHNRKLIANNKRKGRTRIKLDSKKIALAKQLILREATTTVIANELNISRTFAWRLRKSLVNGVSLHERVIDPNSEECPDGTMESLSAAAMEQHQPVPEQSAQPAHAQTEQFSYPDSVIKQENVEVDSEDSEDDLANNMEDVGNEVLNESDIQRAQMQANSNREHVYPAQYTINKVTRMRSVSTTLTHREQVQYSNPVESDDDEEDGHDDTVQANVNDNTKVNDVNEETDKGGDEAEYAEQQRQQHQLNDQSQDQVAQDSQLRAHFAASRTCEPERLQAQQEFARFRDLETSRNGGVPLLNQFPPAVAAAIHQLPVNLSIRPVQSLQNQEKEKTYCNNRKNTSTGNAKKPRKPNVFVDEEKYALAKTLVAQNSSTMEIARALNVSQMTAWKVRDAIVKGIPLSYRCKRDARTLQHAEVANESQDYAGSGGSTKSESLHSRMTENMESHAKTIMVQQQQQRQLQQEQYQQEQLIQQLQKNQQQQQLQQQQQEKHMQLLQRQQLKQEKLKSQQQQLQQQQQLAHVHRQPPFEMPAISDNTVARPASSKFAHPRRRLKAADREQRDKEITREILELIREDNNIQYWKVSARLAEKGFPISPSSVCQKLKSMGIHRRWKPGDKPPIVVGIEHLKAAGVIANTLTAPAAPTSIAEEGYGLDMGGTHFLSAFTH